MRSTPRFSLGLAVVGVFGTLAFACGGVTFAGGTPGSDGGSGDSGAPPDAPAADATCNIVRLVPQELIVLDADTHQPICDAALVSPPAGVELSPCTGGACGSEKCAYTVTGPIGSSFAVTVGASGYRDATATGLMEGTCGCSSECPEPAPVTVSLLPSDLPPPPLDAGSGDAGTGDAGSGGCPAGPPTSGASCDSPALECEYGTDPRPSCNELFQCTNGVWVDENAGAGACAVEGTCPGFVASKGSSSCPVQGTFCSYPAGSCVCSNDPGGLPIEGGPVWSCSPAVSGCPAPRPNVGSPCDASSAQECDYGACEGGFALDCIDGHWQIDHMIACPA